MQTNPKCQPTPFAFLLSFILLTLSSPAAHAQPTLQKTGPVTQLYVNNHPFLALGGELGNSTASDLHVLTAAFDKLQQMHLNTVMLPVYWDRLEPAEGTFDYTLIQGAIESARAHNLHLVLLWFGTWKNSMSCYAPGWIKRDTTRFPRVRLSNGEPAEIITPQSTAARDADATAFAALMHWLKDFDAQQQTVIMVQVENEIGMIPEARDHSDLSNQAYAAQVPPELLTQLTANTLGPEIQTLWQTAGHHSTGTWQEIFGPTPQGQEVFSAWQFATYVQHVAAAGKAQYPIPMYVNAALMRPNYTPGQYPAAGPLPHLLELWRLGAPALDMLSPDIYFPNFMDWAQRYTRSANPLFIPETAPSARASANALFAIAHLNAIGVGPFSIENQTGEKAKQLTDLYTLLEGLAPQILTAQQQQKILGLSPTIAFDWTAKDTTQEATLANIQFQAEFDTPASALATSVTNLPTLGPGRWEAPPSAPLGSLMILQLAPEEFIVVGKAVTLTFAPADGNGKVGIDEDQEGRYTPDGAWIGGLWLNGDQTHQGRHLRFEPGAWSLQRVKLYRYH